MICLVLITFFSFLVGGDVLRLVAVEGDVAEDGRYGDQFFK